MHTGCAASGCAASGCKGMRSAHPRPGGLQLWAGGRAGHGSGDVYRLHSISEHMQGANWHLWLSWRSVHTEPKPRHIQFSAHLKDLKVLVSSTWGPVRGQHTAVNWRMQRHAHRLRIIG